MTITAMRPNDLSEVAELEAECFSQPWSRQVLEAELQNPNSIFLTAHKDGQIAGYVGMHRVLDEGYLFNIAVKRAFRRNGVATSLMERLLQYAREQNLAFLTLEVREGNHSAIHLYDKLGFGKVGQRKQFYANPTEDAVLMTIFMHSSIPPESVRQDGEGKL